MYNVSCFVGWRIEECHWKGERTGGNVRTLFWLYSCDTGPRSLVRRASHRNQSDRYGATVGTVTMAG